MCTEAAQAAESYTSFYQQEIQRSCVTVKVMLNVSSTGLVGPQPEDIRPEALWKTPKNPLWQPWSRPESVICFGKEPQDMSKKMLVVSAHGADWCTRAGGTILKYVNAGWEVTVYALTFGEHGESGAYWKDHWGTNVEEVKHCRKTEAQAAAAFMGVKRIEFFDYGDYPLDMGTSRVQDLICRIMDLRPDVILTHWIDDPFNMDHEITGKAVVRAVSACGMRGAIPDTDPHFIPDIFFFETTMPHSEFNHFEIDTYLDIGDAFEKKIQAVKLFAAQPQLVEYYTRCAKNRGVQANDWSRGRRSIQYAEGFKRYVPYLGDCLPVSSLEERFIKEDGYV